VTAKCLPALLVTALVLVSSVLHAQAKLGGQGGTLVLQSGGTTKIDGSTYVQAVALVNYVGEPLKALQLRVISSGGLRLRSVERGTHIATPSEWNLSHVIAPGKNGVDTAKVVIFGFGTASLPPREFSELLALSYDIDSTVTDRTARLSLINVLGALTRGENAHVVAGPPRTVSLKNK
jgi:hypothetical protein